jgi:DNA mismatch repair protein MutS2
MEPEPALEFNNEEIRLAAAEQAEETAVLQSLTFTLIDMSESMMDLLQRVTALDLACARAGYAMWLNAVRPVFCENDMAFFHKNPYMDQLMVDIEGARHPLLLGTALSASLNTQWHGVIHQNKINTGSSSSSISTGNASSFGFIETTLPVPIDIKICESVKVVTITGPNTGGKTATLKTLGVIVLMAKAGLFVPAVGQPQLPWFDRILADIGDDQVMFETLASISGCFSKI